MANNKKGNPAHMAESTIPTPEQIAGWKKQYGEDDVFCYEADDKTGWLRRPDRRIIGFAGATGTDRLNQKEIVIRQCWLGGDVDLINVDKYFYGLAAEVDELTEVVTGSLKKV